MALAQTGRLASPLWRAKGLARQVERKARRRSPEAMAKARMVKAILALPERQRETFVLCRFGRKTCAEIAAMYGVQPKTVERRFAQALIFLVRAIA